MADRIARPPVRVRGGLPEGTLAGVPESLVKELLGTEPDPVYGLVKLGRRQLVHDDEAEADVAVLGVLAIEVLANGIIPVAAQNADHGTSIAEALSYIRGERLGDVTLDFENATDHAAEEEAEVALTDWQAAEGLSDVQLGEAWKDYFGEQAGSWRDADARTITEFLTAKREQDDEPAGRTLASVPDGGDDDAV